MTARRRTNMRRLVDNTLAMVRAGELSTELAAQKLHENGVPTAVIGRVLSDASVKQPSLTPQSERRPEPEPFTKATMAPGQSGWRQGGWLSLAWRG